MVKPGPKPRPLTDRLAKYVTEGDPDACWEFTGYRLDGYGRLNVQGSPRLAHRIAYELAHGPVPDGLNVCHRCDNPPCCNPAHLFVGGHADNVADMVAKGRARGPRTTGEGHHSAKLTDEQVAALRARYAAGGVTQRALALAYGVTQAQVWNILHDRQRRPPCPIRTPRE